MKLTVLGSGTAVPLLNRNCAGYLLEAGNKKAEGHLTPSLAGKIAAASGARHLVLTHFYPEVLKTDIKMLCSKEFNGKITLAKDKMKIKI